MASDLNRDTIRRVPPHDLAIEASVLGAMLFEPEATASGLAELQGTDFYSDNNRALFEAIRAVHDSGRPADILTVGAELQRRGHLDRLGGQSMLAELSETIASTANVGHHCRLLREKAQYRAVIYASARTWEQAYAQESQPDDLVGRAMGEFARILQLPDDGRLVPLADSLDADCDRIERWQQGTEVPISL